MSARVCSSCHPLSCLLRIVVSSEIDERPNTIRWPLKATLGLMATESVFLGSSGSGEESNIGTLFIMCDTPLRRVAHINPLWATGVIHSDAYIFPFRSLGKSRGRGTGQSSFDHAATGTLIPVGLSQFPCAQVGATCPRQSESHPKAGSARARWRTVPGSPDQAAALLAAISWLVGTSTVKLSTVGGPMMRGFINLTIFS